MQKGSIDIAKAPRKTGLNLSTTTNYFTLYLLYPNASVNISSLAYGNQHSGGKLKINIKIVLRVAVATGETRTLAIDYAAC